MCQVVKTFHWFWKMRFLNVNIFGLKFGLKFKALKAAWSKILVNKDCDRQLPWSFPDIY